MRIIIVGNGRDVLCNEYGSLIDSSDIVIRMGQYRLDGFEKNVGTKTDIYSSKWFAWWDRDNNWSTFRKMNVDKFSEVWFQFNDPISDTSKREFATLFEQEYLDYWAKTSFKQSNVFKNMDFSMHRKLCKQFNLRQKKIIYYNCDDLLEMIRLLNFEKNSVFMYNDIQLVEPTTGIRTIQMAMKYYSTHDIYIIGFDGCATGCWYWDLEKLPNPKHDYPNEREVVANWLKNGKIKRLETLCV